MRIAITGSSGGVGRAVQALALEQGHTVVGIDRIPPEARYDGVRFVRADMSEYDTLVDAFAGCDAVVHMAAIPSPRGGHPDHVIHNNNVVGSYNALRAAAEHGIRRICQASSVNAIGHAFSRRPRYDYFPLDEQHPNYSEEPYSLSKWICEQQADAFVRRYDGTTIASMRFHWVVPDRATAGALFNARLDEPGKHLWAYTLFDAAARACLLSLNGTFEGHQPFFIVAPDTTTDVPSLELAARYFPNVPVTGNLSGNGSFFSSSKAERLLGWKHHPVGESS